jgi:succinate dehydrogenase / fumarate reductase cytochrome b subunit
MFILGLLILAFLLLHMGDFWVKMKWGQLPTVQYAGMDHEIYNLYWRVNIAFQQPWIVIVYLLGVLALAFHLWHGFQSAFQTLGINHNKYTPLIHGIGKAYSIIIPLGFAILPVYYYFFRQLME